MRRQVTTVDDLRATVGHPNTYTAKTVGTLSFIPGRAGTLRINGTARFLADADYFDAMTVQGKRPILALEIDPEEVFFQWEVEHDHA